MAEILLSLTIIGVVAAITLPSLTGNINERTWNTQRKALFARMSQAIALMPAVNGYGTLVEGDSNNVAETFITAGLSKVIKINNICNADSITDCGISSKMTTLRGSTISTPLTMGALNSYMIGSHSTGTDNMNLIDTKVAAFETQNGESILTFYNPYCIGSLKELPLRGDGGYYIAKKVCANFIYDLNGSKGPNTVGKDIGAMTLIYPSDPTIVAPIPLVSDLPQTYKYNDAIKACHNFDSESRVPNIDELFAIFANKELYGLANALYWSSTVVDKDRAWFTYNDGSKFMGQIDDKDKAYNSLNVRCVKR
ncbi:MAG: hypothetical protein NC390_03995 [Fusobacterium sp.]|nr:hypothetical protein [Fusobacterium sp.]